MTQETKAGGTLNIPDIIFGVVLFFGLPLGTLMAIKSYQKPPAPAVTEEGTPATPVIAMSLAEIDERMVEFDRIFKKNGQMFLSRGQNPEFNSDDCKQEQGWARLTLERCQKGFKETMDGAMAAPPIPVIVDRRERIKKWIVAVDDELRKLPASSAPRPDPKPSVAAPAAPPAPGTEPAPAPPASGANGPATGAAK